MTAVRNIQAVTAKELYCYFASPVAYVFFIIFLMMALAMARIRAESGVPAHDMHLVSPQDS